MTDVIVTDAHSTAIYGTQSTNIIVTGLMGPTGSAGVRELRHLDDVSAQAPASGSTLVYNTTTTRWEATRLLNNQNIDCGEF